MALSTATLGSENNDNNLKAKSLQAYGLAMQQLAASLKQKSPHNDGVLAAVQLMRTFELLFGADPDSQETSGLSSQTQSFRRHIDGETALILSRGPNHAWSSSGRQLLADGRLSLITAYISRRRRSPFSHPEWKQTHLWHSVTDSPINKLLDVMVEIPGLLQDLDVMRQAPTPKETQNLHTDLSAKCQACELALLAWEVEIGDDLRTYDYTADNTVPLPWDEDNLALLYLSHLYWMTCLMLFSTMGFCELEDPQAKANGDFGDLLSSSAQKTAKSYAYRIAHSIDLLFQPPAGTYSAAASFFPLGNALRYLIMLETYGGQNIFSKERLMLIKAFKRPFLGSFVGRFLRNLQADDGIDYDDKGLVGMRAIDRYTAPNTTRLEAVLSSFLGGPCLTYSSGLAAFHALVVFLNPSRIAIGRGYHGCHGVVQLVQKLKPLESLSHSEEDLAKIQKGDVIHVETPFNPTGEAVDLAYYRRIATERGAWLTCDATLAPPPLQNPFDLGVDFIMHSGTKYIGGHSDMLCGVLSVRPDLESSKKCIDGLWNERAYLGSVMGSMEGWLGVRSMRTLELRIQQQSQSAEALVKWLDDSRKVPGVVADVVSAVEHASLQPEAKDETSWLKKQMPNGYGGVFALLMKSEELAKRLPSKLHLFDHATSLGGVESLIEWRAISDASIDKRVLRVSIGVEGWEDLKADFLQAFTALQEEEL
ncbi:hypothetical protein FDECE_16187 [Fusarium decemcellulare]|nr:hypothetical protein FDECE_16187 [Fusarium decemcellulare]